MAHRRGAVIGRPATPGVELLCQGPCWVQRTWWARLGWEEPETPAAGNARAGMERPGAFKAGVGRDLVWWVGL